MFEYNYNIMVTEQLTIISSEQLQSRCELLLVSYTINRVKIITIKMCVVINSVCY